MPDGVAITLVIALVVVGLVQAGCYAVKKRKQNKTEIKENWK